MQQTPPKSFYRRQLPQQLTDLNSEEGKKRFSSALQERTAESFFPLISQLQTQAHPAFCALTSLSTVLNALEIDPKRVWAHPWRWFAESMLDCCLDMDHIKMKGMTLDQLARTAQCQGSDVQVWRYLDIDRARDLILRCVQGNPDGSFQFVVASYDRKVLRQTGTGHFSPIAAYDQQTDSVLILDVARFKEPRDLTNSSCVPIPQYGPHWVQLQDLLEATRSVDASTGLQRGFLTFRKLQPDDNRKSDDCNARKCSEKCRDGYKSTASSQLSLS